MSGYVTAAKGIVSCYLEKSEEKTNDFCLNPDQTLKIAEIDALISIAESLVGLRAVLEKIEKHGLTTHTAGNY